MKRFAQIIGLILVVAIAGCAITYGWMARDRAPTNAALAQTELPKTIAFREFFADMNAEWEWKISPDGEHVAWHAATFGGVDIKVAPVANTADVTTIETGSVDHMFWHVDGRVAILREGRLWAVDPNSPAEDDWTDITPRGFNVWNISKSAITPNDSAIIASNDREVEAWDLYSTNANYGDRSILTHNPGDVTVFGLTPRGEAVIRLARKVAQSVTIEKRDGLDSDNWSAVTTFNQRDSFFPVLMPEHGKDYYALSNRGRNLLSLVKVNWNTGAETVVASNTDADMQNVLAFFPDAKEPDIVISPTSETLITPISALGRAFVETVDPENELTNFYVTSVSYETRRISFTASYNGKFYINRLYDVETNTVTDLGAGAFKRHDDKLAESRTVFFEASDGTSIPAILTLPKLGPNAGAIPAIVDVHGGPAAHTRPGYLGNHQFLANRGYAVLAVNFRGSTGYGKTFRSAGYGQVGKAMQTDISDAARWLIQEGIADPDAIGVMGGSYGGFSSALAMTRDPDLFKAAVVDVAVLDVVYQMDNNPFGWGLQLDEMQRYFGDPENEADRAKMVEMSPITHAADVHGPILLTHGKLDRTVSFEQTERFAAALEENDIPHEMLLFEREGHSYYRWQTDVVYWRKVEQFFAEHLGGRDGGFDYVELGPTIFGD